MPVSINTTVANDWSTPELFWFSCETEKPKAQFVQYQCLCFELNPAYLPINNQFWGLQLQASRCTLQIAVTNVSQKVSS
jgi:hypothetical protein